MRHRKHHHQLGVKSAHRLALLANLAAALLRHGQIKTTLSKAKALRPFIEKIITLAKRANAPGTKPERTLYLRRLALARVRDKDAVKILFNEKAKEFFDRSGGYTRIYKLGFRRGDAAETALIQLIPANDTGYKQSGKSKKMDETMVQGSSKTGKTAAVLSTDDTASNENAVPAATGSTEAKRKNEQN